MSLIDKFITEIDKGLKFSTLNYQKESRQYPAQNIEEYSYKTSQKTNRNSYDFSRESNISNKESFRENLIIQLNYLAKIPFLSVFSQEKEPSCSGILPKWPYAAVFSYIGLLSPNISLIPRGERSKF